MLVAVADAPDAVQNLSAQNACGVAGLGIDYGAQWSPYQYSTGQQYTPSYGYGYGYPQYGYQYQTGQPMAYGYGGGYNPYGYGYTQPYGGYGYAPAPGTDAIPAGFSGLGDPTVPGDPVQPKAGGTAALIAASANAAATSATAATSVRDSLKHKKAPVPAPVPSHGSSTDWGTIIAVGAGVAALGLVVYAMSSKKG